MRIILSASIAMLVGFAHLQCNRDQQRNKNVIRVHQLNSSGHFIRDIQGDRQWLAKVEQSTGLNSIVNGFDSIQIRFWYGCNMATEKVVILTYSGNKWKAEISDREYLLSRASAEYDSIVLKKILLPSEPDWENFIDKLFKLQLLVLPSLENVRNFKPVPAGADGCYVAVEIATKNIYRYYEYGNPDEFEDQYEEAKNITNILKIINRQFKLKELIASSDIYDMWPIKHAMNEGDTLKHWPKKIQIEDLDSNTQNEK